MKVYGLRTCDRCRAALRALRECGHDPVLVDLRADGVGRAEFERFLARFGDALINRRSASWRGMDAAARAADPLDMLLARPALMKRPVIDSGEELFLGWDDGIRAALCG